MTAQLMTLGDIILRPFGISQLLAVLEMYSVLGQLKVYSSTIEKSLFLDGLRPKTED